MDSIVLIILTGGDIVPPSKVQRRSPLPFQGFPGVEHAILNMIRSRELKGDSPGHRSREPVAEDGTNPGHHIGGGSLTDFRFRTCNTKGYGYGEGVGAQRGENSNPSPPMRWTHSSQSF